MAFDQKGKYHMSPHHAKATDKADAQRSKPGTEPQPGPDGMSGGKNGGKDLSAGIPTPGKQSTPSGLKAPSSHPSVLTSAPSTAGGDDGGSDLASGVSASDVPQHPAHEAADSMGMQMGDMEPQDLMVLKSKLEGVLQQITDLLDGGASESQAMPAQAGPMLGGY